MNTTKWIFVIVMIGMIQSTCAMLKQDKDSSPISVRIDDATTIEQSRREKISEAIKQFKRETTHRMTFPIILSIARFMDASISEEDGAIGGLARGFLHSGASFILGGCWIMYNNWRWAKTTKDFIDPSTIQMTTKPSYDNAKKSIALGLAMQTVGLLYSIMGD